MIPPLPFLLQVLRKSLHNDRIRKDEKREFHERNRVFREGRRAIENEQPSFAASGDIAFLVVLRLETKAGYSQTGLIGTFGMNINRI